MSCAEESRTESLRIELALLTVGYRDVPSPIRILYACVGSCVVAKTIGCPDSTTMLLKRKAGNGRVRLAPRAKSRASSDQLRSVKLSFGTSGKRCSHVSSS